MSSNPIPLCGFSRSRLERAKTSQTSRSRVDRSPCPSFTELTWVLVFSVSFVRGNRVPSCSLGDKATTVRNPTTVPGRRRSEFPDCEHGAEEKKKDGPLAPLCE